MWGMFDFGGAICTAQPEEDLAALAATAGVSVAEFQDAYWQARTAYDTAALTAVSFWQDVAGRLGRPFGGAQVDELVRLDIAGWTQVQEGTVSLIGELAAAGHRLALLSNAPVEAARAVGGLPVARHFEHLLFSCDFKAAKLMPVASARHWAGWPRPRRRSSCSTTARKTWPRPPGWACGPSGSPGRSRCAPGWPESSATGGCYFCQDHARLCAG